MLQDSPLPTMTAALSRRYATSCPLRFAFRTPMVAAPRCYLVRSLADNVDAVFRRLAVQRLPVDSQHPRRRLDVPLGLLQHLHDVAPLHLLEGNITTPLRGLHQRRQI